MNKTIPQTKEERYESPEILDIAPVSVAVKGGGTNPNDGNPEDSGGE